MVPRDLGDKSSSFQNPLSPSLVMQKVSLKDVREGNGDPRKNTTESGLDVTRMLSWNQNDPDSPRTGYSRVFTP